MVVADISTVAPSSGAAEAPTRRRVLLHLTGISIVLLSCLAFVGPGIFTIDENAYRTQAAVLEEGFLVDFPTDGLIDQNAVPPLALSTTTAEGWAPYSRHPLYPILLWLSQGLSVTYGPVLVSILGTLAAAFGVGRLRQSIDGGSPIPAWWATAVLSPLFIHSQIVWAHTLAVGAAACGIAFAFEAMDPARRWIPAATASGACVALSAFFRTEAVFIPLGIAVATFLISPRSLPRWLAVNTVVGGSAGAAALVDRWWAASVIGGSRTSLPAAPPSSVSWLDERVSAATNLFMSVGGGAPRAQLWLLVPVLLGIAWAKGRAERPDRGLVRALAAASVVAAMVAATAVQPLSGWVPAIPFLVLALAGGLSTERARPHLAMVVAVLVAVAFVAPADGGGLGWGGRYLLIALPPIVAVAVVVCSRLSADRLGRTVVAAGLAATVLVQISGLRVLQRHHEASVAGEERISAFLRASPDDLLLIAADIRIGRSAPTAAAEHPLLSPGRSWLTPAVLDLVRDGGVERVAIVELSSHNMIDIPDGWVVVSDVDDGFIRSRTVEFAG